MRVTENVIVKYCDFCSLEKKQRATAACGICSSDLCDAHRNLIPILKTSFARHLVGSIPQGQTPLLLRFDFASVCPDCCHRSFFSLVEALAQKRSQTQSSQMKAK